MNIGTSIKTLPTESIRAITPGDDIGTWNVFRCGDNPRKGGTVVSAWTDEMSIWYRGFYRESR